MTGRRTSGFRPLRFIVSLLCAGACLAVAQGVSIIPVAAFAGYALLIRSIRSAPAWAGYGGLVVVHTVAWDFAYAEAMPMPAVYRVLGVAGLSLVLGLIFLVDRGVAKRFQGFATTLVLPAGVVGLELVIGLYGQGGSTGSLAYSFTDHLALAQLASVTGWTGLTFLVLWVAATANYAWEHRAEPRRAVRGVAVCAGVFATILALGSLRLWWLPTGELVRVAGVVGPTTYSENGERRPDVMDYLRRNPQSAEDRAAARRFMRAAIDETLGLVEAELRAGARLVALSEANPVVRAEEAAHARAIARTLASSYSAYVGLGLYSWPEREGEEARNTFLLFGPDGAVVWDYDKSKRPPGSEHAIGPGTLPYHDTPFGRWSPAICFDLDFPALLRQAGRNAVDIVVAPSNDWTGNRLLHARMATMRAIEQGFSLVRPTEEGISVATDPLGRTLAWQDTDRPGVHVLSAEVPTRGVSTVYSRIGNLFAWLCVGGFAFAIGALVLGSHVRSDGERTGSRLAHPKRSRLQNAENRERVSRF